MFHSGKHLVVYPSDGSNRTDILGMSDAGLFIGDDMGYLFAKLVPDTDDGRDNIDDPVHVHLRRLEFGITEIEYQIAVTGVGGDNFQLGEQIGKDFTADITRDGSGDDPFILVYVESDSHFGVLR